MTFTGGDFGDFGGGRPDPIGDHLRELADSVPPPAVPPTGLRARAGRRRRAKLAGLGALGVLVVGGAFAGGALLPRSGGGVDRLQSASSSGVPSQRAASNGRNQHPRPAPTVTVTVTAPPGYQAGATCQPTQLSANVGPLLRRGAERGTAVTLRNHTAVPCLLTGHAGLEVKYTSGLSGSLVANVGRTPFVAHPAAATSFTLPAGGAAWFSAAWSTRAPSCHTAAWLLVTPPNTYTQLPVWLPPVPVCGRFLTETPLQPGAPR